MTSIDPKIVEERPIGIRSRKTLKGEFGEIEVESPRDRKGAFEPKIVGSHQTRWTGFDHKIVSLSARGMSTREIQGHPEDLVKPAP